MNENPPLLYDLTALQKDANKRYGYTAQECLNIAQSLYEKKYITYPRTGSRYISEDVFVEMGQLILALSSNKKWLAAISSLRSNTFNRQSVNGAKVTDHHALLPTEVLPKELPSKEQHIYDMIVARTIEALMPKCEKLSTTVTFEDFKILGYGWYYLSTVLDDYSRYIIHWELCENMKKEDVERYHQSMKNTVKLHNYFCKSELEEAIVEWVNYYNNQRYHESLDNLTPADIYFRRGEEILKQRKIIKEESMKQRRIDYQNNKYICSIP